MNGIPRSISSFREKWYSKYTKYLLNAERYEDCIALCDDALEQFERFHSNNDSWFRYRKASSLMKLDRPEEAEKELKISMRNGFSHWILLGTLFEIERALGKDDQALLYGVKCALADSSHNMRVTFYEGFAEYLLEKGYEKEAALHRRLVICVREENGWPLKNRHSAWSIPDDITSMTKDGVLRELRGFWRKVEDESKTFYEGTVSRLLTGDGGDYHAGFIDNDEGSYYFQRRDVRGNKDLIDVGTNVRFSLVDRLDRKRNEIKPNAVDITILH